MEDDKTIYFIRHGESTYNEWRLRSILNFSWIFVKDPMIVDAPLSTKGKLQVVALKRMVQEQKLADTVEVIITSPLTRAIETTLGGFDGCAIPIQVNRLCREMLDTACDVGRQPDELARAFGSKGIDTSDLSTYWWLRHPTEATKIIPETAEQVAPLRETNADVDARVTAFLAELQAMPQKTIAVVCHSNFIKRATKASRKLANCEIDKTTLRQLVSQHSSSK
ncbi:Aste57867_1635 [Aphanomyces stellatus]|uniref:Aste57867_1635 protein n=1 Tax=Aphanomyces stellatus TaxID=120398 RepID=A0A485K5S0_9STRA|nr:hypothetical protein As57867_001633 [Aphanomyces stellatus]VFT78848.1 Aste57867_1635 [Aphanomyces stellatus]